MIGGTCEPLEARAQQRRCDARERVSLLLIGGARRLFWFIRGMASSQGSKEGMLRRVVDMSPFRLLF